MYTHQIITAALVALLSAVALAGDSGESSDADAGAERAAGSSIYRVVGPDGKVTFTDVPPKDGKAQRVEVGPTNIQPIARPRPLPTRKLSPRDQEDRERQRPLGPINFAIVSPQSGATIPPGQRLIVLRVAIDPVPVGGYQFFAVVDGQRWLGSSSGTSLDLSALERGTHDIQAVLTDLAGRVLARSQPITIFVKRPGATLPDAPAPQAKPAPQAPAAPGVPQPKQQRRSRN
ncbi:DUF4124 domain-containing protein [Microbulbifer yueqingensis]|uniref:DUF4124 domain-containing protein n=1 Tax=Microbulbifer yueqingensis TaxID=658219 RepID=A0A1G9B9J6_9GAMM|nr:DUF4124 domain-containing protein [Microbulbifer yueqingensis]SDK36246.1 protein of unknown function [Microbulbifer yueqingensis]